MNKNDLHKLYLEELTHIDVTHGGNVKNKHPERWNIHDFEPKYPYDLALAISKDIDIWLWSDQHFNHKNIIRYSNRPYSDILDMNEQLIANHNSVVKPNDIVIWGGDIGFGNINQINDYLSRCNGYTIHILGNHDMFRDGKLYPLNVHEVHSCLVLPIEQVYLLFTHYPIDNVPERCINVHGHIHTHPAFTHQHVNISVEQIEYTPINIKTILQRIDQIL